MKRSTSIVIVLFFCMFMMYPPVVNSTSIFIRPVADALKFQSKDFILYISIMSLSSMLASPQIAKCISKYGIQKVMVTGISLISLSLFGFSMSTKLWHFYILALVQGIGIASSCVVPPSIIANNWFHDKKIGVVIGFIMAGSGVGGGIYNPVVQRIISAYNWQVAYVFSAILPLLLIPFVFKYVKLNPEEIDNDLADLTEKSKKNTSIEKNVSKKEMLKTPAFYFVIISILFSGIIINGNNVNISPYLTLAQISTVRSSYIIGISLVCTTLGKIILGKLYDSYGTKRTFDVIGLLSVVFILCLLNIHVRGATLIYVISMGIAAANVTVTPAILTRKIFGNENFGEKYGLIALFISLGSALAPVYTNLFLNNGFSYSKLYVSYIILIIFQMIFMKCAVAIPIKAKEIIPRVKKK